MRVTCTINGSPAAADDIWEGESLLFVLRERLGLPGSKNACEQGECGSCTVYLDGVVVCACLVAAGQAQGRDIRTVEGLGDGGTLGTVQQAFLDAGAVQCGFCTPGLIVAAGRDPLYGADVPPLRLPGGDQARADHHAVQVDRAGPAFALLAGVLGAGQAEPLAQHEQQ